MMLYHLNYQDQLLSTFSYLILAVMTKIYNFIICDVDIQYATCSPATALILDQWMDVLEK